MKSCKIVRHFIEECKGLSNLRFIIIDVLNNVDHFSSGDIDDLLLQKEQFWIRPVVTQQKGLNGTHDWRTVDKVTEQIKFSNPVFPYYMETGACMHFILLTGFFILGTLGL